MKFLQYFKTNFKKGDWVYITTFSNTKMIVELISDNRDGYYEVKRLDTNDDVYGGVFSSEIDRKLTNKEIEQLKLSKKIKKYNI